MELLNLTKNNCNSLCTIDLRNLDVSKIKNNRYVKPKKILYIKILLIILIKYF